MTIDHDAIAAKVRQDRKAGTPGNWIADPHDAEADQDRYDTVFADAGIQGASPLAFVPHFWSAHWVDACRIAGLPRLEAAYLDLYDDVAKLRANLNHVIAERDATFALMLARAEKAEAERDRVAAEWAETSQRNYQRAKAAEAERDALRSALVDHNDLLRSSSQIAQREGLNGHVGSTNWDAYYNRVTAVLKRHHAISNEARKAMKGQTDDSTCAQILHL